MSDSTFYIECEDGRVVGVIIPGHVLGCDGPARVDYMDMVDTLSKMKQRCSWHSFFNFVSYMGGPTVNVPQVSCLTALFFQKHCASHDALLTAAEERDVAVGQMLMAQPNGFTFERVDVVD